MSETPSSPVFRIRWGWFVGCIALGLVAIMIGWLVTPFGVGSSYFAGVLANVGTTLLLVGVVVLLERRIINTAVRLVRSTNAVTNEVIRVQIRDLEDRLASEWKSVTVENLAEKKAETARLTDEFTKRIVEETTGDE
jgi:hypothetical protein